MFLGPGADRNLYGNIFGKLPKATRALCRTHVCRAWYALIAPVEPWTSDEIQSILSLEEGVAADFALITRHWHVLPPSGGKWHRLMQRAIAWDRVWIVDWLSRRCTGASEHGFSAFSPIMEETDLLTHLVSNGVRFSSQLWYWYREHLADKPSYVRSHAFWKTLAQGDMDTFRFVLRSRIWDVRHMGFDRMQTGHFAYGIRNEGRWKECVKLLKDEGATDDFWSGWIKALIADKDTPTDRIVYVVGVSGQLKPKVCEYLKKHGNVALHNLLRAWCQCQGPVLRDRRRKRAKKGGE